MEPTWCNEKRMENVVTRSVNLNEVLNIVNEYFPSVQLEHLKKVFRIHGLLMITSNQNHDPYHPNATVVIFNNEQEVERGVIGLTAFNTKVFTWNELFLRGYPLSEQETYNEAALQFLKEIVELVVVRNDLLLLIDVLNQKKENLENLFQLYENSGYGNRGCCLNASNNYSLMAISWKNNKIDETRDTKLSGIKVRESKSIVGTFPTIFIENSSSEYFFTIQQQ